MSVFIIIESEDHQLRVDEVRSYEKDDYNRMRGVEFYSREAALDTLSWILGYVLRRLK